MATVGFRAGSRRQSTYTNSKSSQRRSALSRAVEATCRSIVEPLEQRIMFASTLLTGSPFGLMPNQGVNFPVQNAFDGNLNTYSQSASQDGAYVGIDLGNGNGVSVHRVRFAPVGNFGSFFNGGKFQGSTNGVDYTNLLDPLTSGVPNGWTDISFTPSSPVRYIRYAGANGSYARIAELQFYTDVPATAPAAPTSLSATELSPVKAQLSWQDNSNNETGFRVERKLGLLGAWAELTTVAAGINSFADTTVPQAQPVYYRVRANNEASDWSYSNEATLSTTGTYSKLNGAVYGANPNNSTNALANAFDGNTNTAYISQSTTGSGHVGIDLGSGNAKPLLKVRYYPQAGFESRMKDGKFQGSNNGTDYTTLYTVPDVPARGWSDVYFTSSPSYRYYRLNGRAGTYTTVAELEFYTMTAPATPTGLSVAMGGGSNTLSWSAVSDAAGYNVYRGTTPGTGTLYQSNVTSTTFDDSALTAGAPYYYSISAANPGGESSRTGEVVAASATRVNFQPASAAVPAGYLADSGAVFGDRGNGHSYGWNTSNTANVRDRESFASIDQRYDTTAFMQAGGVNRTWSIDVPVAGDYQVRVVAGDMGATAMNLNLLVNGQEIIPSFVTGGTRQWMDGTKLVTVPSGGPLKITLSPGPNANNASLLFVEILPMGAVAEPTAAEKPTGLRARPAMSWMNDLLWTYTGTNATGFEIQRKLASQDESHWATVTTVGLDVRTYNDFYLSSNTSYDYRVRAFNAAGETEWSQVSSATTFSNDSVQRPYGGVVRSVTDRIEAEDFDTGNENTAWSDVNTLNLGGVYRRTGVDVMEARDAGDELTQLPDYGYQVTWSRLGEWLEYSVDVQSAGWYRFDARVGYHTPGGSFKVDLISTTGTTNVVASMIIPNTGSWHDFTTESQDVFIPSAGQFAMRVTLISEGVGGNSGNINWMQFTPTENASPVLSNIEPDALEYAENASAAPTTTSITVSDSDDTMLQGATVAITGNYVPGEDVLTYNLLLPIVPTWNSATGTLTLSGNASLANYQTALRGVRFSNSSEDPSTLVRTISYTVSDGIALSNTVTRNINVEKVNDAPTISVPGSQFTESNLVFSTAAGNPILVSDVDASAGELSVTLSVTGGALTLATLNGLEFVDGDGADDESMWFVGTLADINAALNGLTFTSATGFVGDAELEIVVDDQSNTGTGGPKNDSDSVTISVSSGETNDPPSIAVPAAQSTNEDISLILSGTKSIVISDSDAGTGKLNVTLGVSAGTLTLGSTTGLDVITATGTSSTPMEFEGTLADINAALNTLTFAPPANESGTVTLSIAVDDKGNTGTGGPQSDDDTVSITVNPVNDAPSFLKGANITVEDGAALQTHSGWATALSAGPFNEVGQGLTFLVTNDRNDLFDVQPSISTDGALTFRPKAAVGGTATISVVLQDDGGTANGGVNESAIQYFEIRIGSAPVANPGGPYEVNEGGSIPLSAASAVSFGGTITGYEWDLNYDGQIFDVDVANSTNVAPTFSAAGLDGPMSRTIALRVTDERIVGGVTQSRTSPIATAAVFVKNVAPTATIAGGPSTGDERTVFHYTSGTTDPANAGGIERDTPQYRWRVSRGGAFIDLGSMTANAADFYFIAPEDGGYKVSLEIADGDGGYVVSNDISVTSDNLDPLRVAINGPTSGDEGNVITLTATATDPVGKDDLLTYSWAIVKIEGDETAAVASGVGRSFDFRPDDNGIYEATVIATGDPAETGATTSSASATYRVTVNNVAPRNVAISGPVGGVEGHVLVFTSTAEDVAGLRDPLQYSWSATKGEDPIDLTNFVTDHSTFRFLPLESGDYTLTLTVTDGDEGQSIATHSVVVVAAYQGDLVTSLTPLHDTPTNQSTLSRVVRQPDGKIVALHADYPLNLFTLVRYNSDGTTDRSFGNQGVARLKVNPKPDFPNYTFTDLLLMPDGKFLLSGYYAESLPQDSAVNPADPSTWNMFLARFNPDGSLDDGTDADATPGDEFGTDGMVLDTRSGYTLQLYIVGDKILSTAFIPQLGCHIFAYTLEGEIITDFGDHDGAGGRKGSIFFVAGGLERGGIPTNIVAQSDGKFLVGSNPIMRFTADGAEDTDPVTGFGPKVNESNPSSPRTGRLFFYPGWLPVIPEGGFTGTRLTMQNDPVVGERILVSGGLTHWVEGEAKHAFYPAVARLNLDGTFDDGFGNSATPGIQQLMSVESWSVALSLVPGTGGTHEKILILGATRSGQDSVSLYLNRLTHDGDIDTSFEDADLRSTIPGGLSWVDLASDGRIDLIAPARPPILGEYQTDLGLYQRFTSHTAVRDLTATATPENSIILRWLETGATEDGFTIERAIGDGEFGLFAYVGKNVTEYQDNDILPGTRYQYRVRAFEGDRVLEQIVDSAYSNVATATAAPVSANYIWEDTIYVPIDGDPIESHIVLAPGAHYQLKASAFLSTFTGRAEYWDPEYGGFPLTPDTRHSVPRDRSWLFMDQSEYDMAHWTGHVDYGLAIDDSDVDGNKYPYWGTINSDNDGYLVNIVGNGEKLNFTYNSEVYSGINPPLMKVEIYRVVSSNVDGLTAVADRSRRSISLAWPDVIDEQGFEVWRSNDGGAFTKIATLEAGVTTYTNENISTDTSWGVTWDTTYTYRVRAINSFGTAEFSNDASARFVNLPPVVSGLGIQEVRVGQELRVEIPADDPDGKALEYSLIGENTLPADADTEIEIDPVSGRISGWTPDIDDVGAFYSFTVRVRDISDINGAAVDVPVVVKVLPAADLPPVIDLMAPQTIIGTTTSVSVTATDPEGQPLTYSWNVVRKPVGSIPAMEGTSTASLGVTFDRAGDYRFRITVTDAQGLSSSSTVDVTVAQTPTSITSTPETAVISPSSWQKFTAILLDQFEDPMSADPAEFTWHVPDGIGGTLDPLHGEAIEVQANNNPDDYVIDIEYDTGTGTIYGTIEYTTASSGPEFIINPAEVERSPLTGSSLVLHALGDDRTDHTDPGNEQVDKRLIYTWSVIQKPSGAKDPVFRSVNGASGANGTNNARDIEVVFSSATTTQPYVIRVTMTDVSLLNIGKVLSTSSEFEIDVVHTATAIVITSAKRTVNLGETQQLTATLVDQFGKPMPTQPSLFAWTAAAIEFGESAGTIASQSANTALYTPPPSGNSGTIVTATADGFAGTFSTRPVPQVAPYVKITSHGGSTDVWTIDKDADVQAVVSDANGDLLSYTLKAYRYGTTGVVDLSADNAILLAEGNSEIGGEPLNGETIATLHPTLLADGLYELVLTANDSAGNPPSTDRVTIKVASELKLGNFALPVADTTVQLSGIPVTIVRSYDSLNAGQKGDFGFGWRLDALDAQVRSTAYKRASSSFGSEQYPSFYGGDLLYITLPGGEQHTFMFKPERMGSWNPIGMYYSFKPAFEPVLGTTSTLSVPQEYFGSIEWALELRQAGNEYFATTELGQFGYNPARRVGGALVPAVFGAYYTLRTKDGLEYQIDTLSGRIKSVSNANGVQLTYTDTQITSSTGGSITFTRNNGLITDITDPNGVTTHFDYVDGELREVTDRTGSPTKYRYEDESKPHYLTKVIDSRGLPVLNATYSAGGELSSLTDVYGDPAKLSGSTFKGDGAHKTVTDLAKNNTEFVYDEHGGTVREIKDVRDISGKLVGYSVIVREFDYAITGDLDGMRESRPYLISAPDVTGERYAITPAAGSVDWAASQDFAVFDGGTQQPYLYKGNLISQTDASGRTTAYDYPQVTSVLDNAIASKPTKVTDSYGNETTMGYDAQGNLIWQRNALGEYTAQRYAVAGSVYLAGTLLAAGRPQLDGSGNPVLDGDGQPVLAVVLSASDYYTSADGDYLRNRLKSSATRNSDGTELVTFYGYEPRDSEDTDPEDTEPGNRHFLNQWLSPTEVPNWVRLEKTWTVWTNPENVEDARRVLSLTFFDANDRAVATVTGRVIEDHSDLITDYSLTLDVRQTGTLTLTEYNASGQVSRSRDAFGGWTSFDYDAKGNQIRTVNPDGTVTMTVYDKLGRVEWSLERTTQAQQLNGSWQATAIGNRTFYDSLGRVVRTMRVAGVTIELKDDPEITGEIGGSIKTTALVGSVDGKVILSSSETVYDVQGRVESQTVNGQKTSYRSYTNRVPGPGITNHEIDGEVYATVQEVKDAAGNVTITASDRWDPTAGGRWIREDITIDALGHKTTTNYDQLGRVVKTTFHDGSFTETLYGVGDETVVPPFGVDIDLPTSGEGWDSVPEGGRHEVKISQRKLGEDVVAMHYLYDASGRLTDVWLPAVDDEETASTELVRPHWQYKYQDQRGNQSDQIDPKGHTTHFEYDEFGRRVSRTLPADSDGDPTNDTETWTYDDHGQMLTHTDFKGQTTAYDYNTSPEHGGRLEGEYRFASGVAALDDLGNIRKTFAAESTIYGYDALGRQDSVNEYADDDFASPARSTTYVFDPLTRQLSVVDSPEGVIHYEYNSIGRKTRTWTESNDTSYDYDALGRLWHVTQARLNGQAVNLVTTYTYDAVGNLKTVTQPNGVKTTYTYDDLNRLDLEEVKDNGDALLASYDYHVRSDGMKDYVIEHQKETDGTFSDTKIIWDYNDNGRLISETRDEGNDSIQNGNDYTDTYGFDLVGNRVIKDHDAVGTAQDEIVTSDYNDRDQLEQDDSTLSGVTSFDYDANGSLTAKDHGVQHDTYVWDLRNRMTGATVGGVVSAYTYDHGGVRVSKQVGSDPRSDFVIDKANPTGYAKPFEEKVNGVVKASTLIGLDVIAEADDGSIEFLFRDGRGFARAVTSDTGTVVDRYDIGAYGNLIGRTTSSIIWMSPDGMRDGETNLDYHVARYLDRLTGQFVSYDSFEADPTSPAALHKYLFAESNPVHKVDPTGHRALELVVVASIMLIVGLNHTRRITETVKHWNGFRWSKGVNQAQGGYDVTIQLKNLRKDALAQWSGEPASQQDAQLRYLGFNLSKPWSPITTWDINEMFGEKQQWLSPPGTKSGTVTVNGRVYWQDEVNYYWYGVIARLKDERKSLNGVPQNSLPGALATIFAYRDTLWGSTGIEGRQAWAKAGYYGDFSYVRGTNLGQFNPSGPYPGGLSARFGRNSEDRADETFIAVGMPWDYRW